MAWSGLSRRLLRLTLRRSSPLTAVAAMLLPLSLFLTWFEVTSGSKEGSYTGWFSFHRTDRVLALLALAALASAFLTPSRRTAAVRAVLGLLALAVAARELASPPVVDPSTELRSGAYLGLLASIAVGLGSVSALSSGWLRSRAAAALGATSTRAVAGIRWFRGEPEPVRGAAAPSPSIGRGVFRGVPSLSPAAFGLFRIAFGLGLLLVMTAYEDLPSTAVPVDQQQGESWFAQLRGVEWLAGDPGALAVVNTVTIAAIALFTVGLLARIGYSIAAVGCALAALVQVAATGTAHDWGLPAVTLLCLLIVPWGESGLGLDALLRRRRGTSLPDVPSRRYGLAVWIPGLTMGVGLLAAAYAKFANSGVEWVTGGAVKYHFVEDARHAPVDWGLRLTSVDELAVLMALLAVTVEATVILVTLSPRPAVRLAFGVMVSSLLAGFFLFQGVFWATWWTLLLAFVPWEPIYRGARRLLQRGARSATEDAEPLRPLSGALRIGALALVVLLVGQQVALSSVRVEEEPFLSNYPMYSGTWGSEEEFNVGNSAFTEYRFEIARGSGPRVDVTRRIESVGGEDALLAAYEVREDDELDADEASDLQASLRALVMLYEQRYGQSLGRVYVTSERTVGFDFERGVFDRRVVARDTEVIDPVRFEVATAEDG